MGANLNNVEIWWLFISIISLINIAMWFYSVKYFNRNNERSQLGFYDLRYWQIWLSAIYVFVCAYRSFLPRVDVQRYVLYDSWLSNILLGRTFATFAELCFAIQWAIILHYLVRKSNNKKIEYMPYILVALIVIAETCSWYSVISTNYLGHVFEESLWGICALIVVYCLLNVWPLYVKDYKKIMIAAVSGGLLYFLYLIAVDIPMYFSRWRQDEIHAKEYMSIIAGMRDLSTHWIVTHDWQDWKIETVWMSFYFSVGVWFSIAFINAPGFKLSNNHSTSLKSKKIMNH